MAWNSVAASQLIASLTQDDYRGLSEGKVEPQRTDKTIVRVPVGVGAESIHSAGT